MQFSGFCSPMVDEALLAEIFGAFGQLLTCKIVRDSAGVHGYCDYADYNSARYTHDPSLPCIAFRIHAHIWPVKCE